MTIHIHIHILVHRNCTDPDECLEQGCEHGWTAICGAETPKEQEAQQWAEPPDCPDCIAGLPAYEESIKAREARREARLDDNEYGSGLALAQRAGGGIPGQ